MGNILVGFRVKCKGCGKIHSIVHEWKSLRQFYREGSKIQVLCECGDYECGFKLHGLPRVMRG